MAKYELTTEGGYPLLECASALQKCIRRGMFEEAMFFAIELESKFHDYLQRRLIVILNEDIGVADPQCIVTVGELHRQYAYLKKTAKGRSNSHRLALTNMIWLMCRAQKTRLADDAQTALYRRVLLEGWKVEVPDFAYDKHTKKGRQMGRGWDHWREEGCKLSNVDELNSYEAEATELRKKHPDAPRFGGRREGNGELDLG